MGKLKFSNLASQDLKDIHDYIANDNVSAATKFIELLYKRCFSLTNNPNLGRQRKEFAPGLRSITEGNYLIFYHPLNTDIIIVRVLHTARNIPKVFHR